MEWCFWANSHYWSSQPTRNKRSAISCVIQVAYFKTVNWFGFNFCKYHAVAVGVIQQLPKGERYFYQEVQDRYTKFSVWCMDGKHFEQVLEQLKQIPDIKLEFVVGPSSRGLIIPKPFQPLGLTFYQRGRVNH